MRSDRLRRSSCSLSLEGSRGYIDLLSSHDLSGKLNLLGKMKICHRRKPYGAGNKSEAGSGGAGRNAKGEPIV
jgi:hypothetical protein